MSCATFGLIIYFFWQFIHANKRPVEVFFVPLHRIFAKSNIINPFLDVL